MGEPAIICRVVIRGRVQGIGFRAWTEYAAIDRGLEGWVRNRRDGTVEAVFSGPHDVVTAMVESCRQGPPQARVADLEIIDGNADDLSLRRRGERFSQLATV